MKTYKIFFIIMAIILSSCGNNIWSPNNLISETDLSNSNHKPNRVLVGYWESWTAVIHNGGHIKLNSSEKNYDAYNIIQVAFANISRDGTVSVEDVSDGEKMDFPSPEEIKEAQSKGKKILLSLGGEKGAVMLTDKKVMKRFTQTLIQVLEKYGYDGVDVDIETGLVAGPKPEQLSESQISLIGSIKEILSHFDKKGKRLMLTMAPEAAYVVGGIRHYGGPWGAYLPVMEALRDRLDYIHMQYYNTSGMPGLDGKDHAAGTADFLISMTDAIIRGYPVAGSSFKYSGLDPSKVVIGLPAADGAGGGYISTSQVNIALDCLTKGKGCTSYKPPKIYKNLGGLMTWSINWDRATTSKTNKFQFAKNFSEYFGTSSEKN